MVLTSTLSKGMNIIYVLTYQAYQSCPSVCPTVLINTEAVFVFTLTRNTEQEQVFCTACTHNLEYVQYNQSLCTRGVPQTK